MQDLQGRSNSLSRIRLRMSVGSSPYIPTNSQKDYPRIAFIGPPSTSKSIEDIRHLARYIERN
jgi:hypothetical protein